MEIDFSTLFERILRSHDRIIEWRGKLQTVHFDSCPEYISSKLLTGAEKSQFKK